jgi:hypothetical protein
MPARLLWTLGTILVLLGIAARVFGWDPLLRIPLAAVEAVRSDPGTYGVIALGLLLMLAARLFGRWRG